MTIRQTSSTVWLHSYSTNNQVMFNIQLAGELYQDVYEQWGESVSESFEQPAPEGGLAPANSTAFTVGRILQVGGQRSACEWCNRQVELAQRNQCNFQWFESGDRCLRQGARNRVIQGLRSAAADAGLGAAVGWRQARLSGALTGAAAGAVGGYASSLLEWVLFDLNFSCYNEAQQTYDACMGRPADYGYCFGFSGCLAPAQPSTRPANASIAISGGQMK